MKIFLLISGLFVIYTEGYYYHKPDITQQIKMAYRTWNAASNSRDIPAFVNLFSEDSVVFPRQSPPIHGKKVLKIFLEDRLRSGKWPIWRFASFNKLEAECGDTYVTSGNATIKGADGEIFQTNSVRMFRLENGVLKLTLVIFNRNSPKPTKELVPQRRIPKFRSYSPYQYYYQYREYPRYYSGYHGITESGN